MQLLALALALAPAAAEPPPPVVGGAAAAPGDWPSAAAVYYGEYPGCSGVLIAPQVVMTAGHCESSSLDGVFVGGIDLWDADDGERIAVAEVIEHPDSQRTLDAAILILAEPAETEPIEVVRGCVVDELVDGAPVFIVGYGNTNEWGNADTHVLMAASTTVVDHDCDDLDRGCRESESPGGELIAGGDGVDSCTGDSGGPLYLETTWGQRYLAGLTSRAAVPADVACGDGGIYVRLDALLGWIEAEAGLTFEDPDCSPNAAPAPTAEAIFARPGGVGSTLVEPGDPDADDLHTFAIVDAPRHGEATVDGGGLVTYAAPEDYKGVDALTVRVGDGRAEGDVTIDVTVSPVPLGDITLTPVCGAARGAGGWGGLGWLGWLGALALVWRRRGAPP